MAAAVFGGGYFLYQKLFYNPIPQDETMTKEAGTLKREISEDELLKLQYPVFEDNETLNQAVESVVEQVKQDAKGQDTTLDYRSKTLFDTYTSVLLRATFLNGGKETERFYSVNYDNKQKKVLAVEDVLRNQYESDLLDGAAADEVDAMELNKDRVTVYLANSDKPTAIQYADHKEYIALTNPNIPSTYQKDPLEIAAAPKIDPDKPMVAITFDDGPNPNTTPKLLETLKQYNVRSTFFMVGTNAAAYPDIVARICQEGHELANHSWDHPDLGAMDKAEDIIDQYQRTDDAVFEACGHDPVYVRPPFGNMSELYDKVVDRPSILWTIDTEDWKNHSVSIISDTIDKYVQDGSIILLHDIHAESVEAMETVIPMLQEKGYQLVTVGDLFRYGRLE